MTPGPRELPGYDEAIAAALRGVEPLGKEQTPLSEAIGRVLAGDVHADRDQPPFNRVAMDGYAVRSEDIGRVDAFEVIGDISAGADVSFTIAPGQTVRIATGAPLPHSADAVIPHELSDRGNPVRFTIDRLEAGANIHSRGADARAGEVVVPRGAKIEPHHLGVLAAVGCAEIPVARRPGITVMTSGDEVRPVEAEVEPHQIRNSNGPMLEAMARAMGADVVLYRHVRDDPSETEAVVAEAIEQSDVILSVGGVSAGRRDFLPEVYDRAGVRTKVRHAAIQPGKPIFIGEIDSPHGHRHVLGLPGNPVSVLATAHLFAWPILRVLSGLPSDLPWAPRPLSCAARPNPKREAFRPGRENREGAVLVAHWSGSGDLMHVVGATGLIRLPIAEEDQPSGAMVAFLPFAWRV